MRQLFKVGELVIICSVHIKNEALNGQIAQILSVSYNPYSRAYDGELADNSPLYEIDIRGALGSNIWIQSSLRKHYPPSTKSFTEIWKNLRGRLRHESRR